MRKALVTFGRISGHLWFVSSPRRRNTQLRNFLHRLNNYKLRYQTRPGARDYLHGRVRMSDQLKPRPRKNDKNRAASSRRRFLQESAATAVVAAAAPHFLLGKSTRAASRALKIGFIGPRTGAPARFGEGNNFLLPGIRKTIPGGIATNRATYPVQTTERDPPS